MDISDRIKKRRIEIGLSVDQVAEALNVNRATVYRYESKDIEKMPITIIEPLSKILKVSPYYLMGWEEEKNTNKKTAYNPLIKTTVKAMQNMNDDGKEQVADYATLLDESGKYKLDEPQPPLTLSDYTELYTIGTAAAGQGFMYGDHIEDYKLVMSTDIPKHDFAITVQGNSMLPTIMDGEVAFVIKDYEKIDRDIYVLDIDGETVIKRVLFGQDEITLLSDNEEFEPRTVAGYDLKQTRIVGRVVGWEMAR